MNFEDFWTNALGRLNSRKSCFSELYFQESYVDLSSDPHGTDSEESEVSRVLFVSNSRHEFGAVCSCQTEGGALHPAFTQTALTERTQSFVPKTKLNLSQTNELKRPI